MTIFLTLDSLLLRQAIPFCGERKMNFDKFVEQAINDRMELIKGHEAQAREHEQSLKEKANEH